MSKGNQKSYRGGISPRTEKINLSKQEQDNLGLNPINRVGIPGSGSQSTGHPKDSGVNKQQSRQAYDKEQRAVTE